LPLPAWHGAVVKKNEEKKKDTPVDPGYGPVIHCAGSHILSACGDTLVLKGLNYPAYSWGSDPNSLLISEIAKTGANALRLVWRKTPEDAAHNVYLDYVALDSMLSKCTQAGMIAIPELHDAMGSDDPAALMALADWWRSKPVLDILNKYRKNIMINIANEALFVNDKGDPAAQLDAYTQAYKTIINNLRSTPGFDFPLMIDAPDWGQNPDVFVRNNTAASLMDVDPKHNLVFSVHTYWDYYTQAQMSAKLDALLATGLPMVLGEVSNYHIYSKTDKEPVDYAWLLNYCQHKGLSFLIWSWDIDHGIYDECPDCKVSANGLYSSFTPFGNDVLFSPVYGLNTVPARKNNCK
jgi:mannan endo-1,4-beta-mannosidase